MKSFTSAAPRTEPIQFELNGQVFNARPEVAGTVMLEYAALASVQDGSLAAKSILDLFRSVMVEEEHSRFRAYVDSPDNAVHVAILGEIITWLIGEYAQRPTTPLSP